MRIAFYGRLADAIAAEIELDAPAGCSIAELRDRLAAEYPNAADTLTNSRARACIGDAMVADDHVPNAGDRVEFLPPVSGG